MILKVKNISEIGGVVKAPPSKSYSHRAVMFKVNVFSANIQDKITAKDLTRI